MIVELCEYLCKNVLIKVRFKTRLKPISCERVAKQELHRSLDKKGEQVLGNGNFLHKSPIGFSPVTFKLY